MERHPTGGVNMGLESQRYRRSSIDKQEYKPLCELYEDPRITLSDGDDDQFDPGDIEDVRNRTANVIEQAVRDEHTVLVESPPNSGKTTSTFSVVSQADQPITYLTKRHDLYEQAVDLCTTHQLDYAEVPRPHNLCPAFDSEDSAYDPVAVDLYNLGVSAADIHTSLDLTCGPDCDYIDAWGDFDPEAVDVIIGHYKHAYIDSVVEDRVVVVDEFPGDAFEEAFHSHEQGISNFLQNTDELPFDDYFDPIEHRDKQFEEVVNWFAENGVMADAETITDLDNGERYHTLAPFLVYSLLMAVDHGNGFALPWFNITDIDYGDFPELEGLELERSVVIDRERSALFVLTQPDLTDTRAVIGLDGTPTPELWEKTTGVDFDHEQVLPDADAKNTYLREAFGLTIKQVNDSLKPYHSGEITVERDTGILNGVEVVESERPSLITTTNARGQYEQAGVLTCVDETKTYANVLSSNDFSQKTVGVVQGCPHPGDEVLKRWSAYFGSTVEAEGEGTDRTYGDFGDEIYEHFVHRQVLQAVLRFGRDDAVTDTNVYVNTAALPNWVDTEPGFNPKLFSTENRRAIADFLRSCGDTGATKQEIADNVGVSVRTVERSIGKFQSAGLVEVVDNPGPKKNGFIWSC